MFQANFTRRFFNAAEKPAHVSMPSIAIAPGVNANAAIAIELRAMADRLESRDNQVIALGAVIALQVGDVKFDTLKVGQPIRDFRDGLLITDCEARIVRVEME